jgi:hypothetical protein
MKDYFTFNEFANHFRVNPKTIYRQLWAKVLLAYKIRGVGGLQRRILFS